MIQALLDAHLRNIVTDLGRARMSSNEGSAGGSDKNDNVSDNEEDRDDGVATEEDARWALANGAYFNRPLVQENFKVLGPQHCRARMKRKTVSLLETVPRGDGHTVLSVHHALNCVCCTRR